MCRPKGYGFLAFWSENRYTLRPILSGIGCCFRRNYGSVWMYLSFQFQMSKKEKYANSKSLKNFFLLLSNLSNGDIISALRPSSLKTGVKNDIFWSEIGDLENRAAHPHQEFPRSTPTPPGTLNSRTVVELDKRVNFNFRVFFSFFFSLHRYGWIKHCKGRNLNAYSEYNFRHCLIPGNWQEIRAFLTQGSQLMY